MLINLYETIYMLFVNTISSIQITPLEFTFNMQQTMKSLSLSRRMHEVRNNSNKIEKKALG